MSDPHLHGVLAEFTSAEQLLAAVARARIEIPHAILEAYSPLPVEGLIEALGPRKPDRIPFWMLLGAIVGGAGTFALEWYAAVWNYPLNVGGRPTESWLAFLPAAIEMTVLGAALFGVLAMLIGNGLPRWHHPLFAVESFGRASSDRFFLLLRAIDPDFDAQRACEFLRTLTPLTIRKVQA